MPGRKAGDDPGPDRAKALDGFGRYAGPATLILASLADGWRSRYGEEFTELLISEIAERARSRSRTADVIRGGIVARLADAGVYGCAPEAAQEAAPQVRASLASLACCAAVFLGFGGAMWSQLTIGWQWSAPDEVGAVATFVMSGAMLVFAVLAVLAALPVACTVLRYQTRLAVAACLTMAAFLGGCCAWVADRTPRDGTGPGNLFHAGTIDVARLVVMRLALAVARQAARQARAGAR